MAGVIKFDGNDPPDNPTQGSLKVQSVAVVNASTSEAGTTIRDIVRAKLHTVSCQFELSSPEIAVLAGMVIKDSVKVTVWLPDTGAEGTLTCYLSSDFKPVILAAAGDVGSDTALWQVDLELTEF